MLGYSCLSSDDNNESGFLAKPHLDVEKSVCKFREVSCNSHSIATIFEEVTGSFSKHKIITLDQEFLKHHNAPVALDRQPKVWRTHVLTLVQRNLMALTCSLGQNSFDHTHDKNALLSRNKGDL